MWHQKRFDMLSAQLAMALRGGLHHGPWNCPSAM